MDEQHRLITERLEKLERLEELSVDPYPYGFERTHRLAQVHAQGEALIAAEQRVKVAGRIMAKRPHGKLTFAHIEDQDSRLQLFVRKDVLGEDPYAAFKLFDVGDIVGAEGTVVLTKTGELSVMAESVTLLTKSLRPLPEKWHGLQDKELRYRQRYLDLIMSSDVRATFTRRTDVIQTLREVLLAEEFLEVETPVLQPLYGGATARPFTTHHNALDMTLYLRIADELYLKRLVAGGFERVFEFGKDFRNEGIDRTHNPEFTMLECYAAYWDYEDVMGLVQRMFARLAEKFTEDGKLTYGDHVIDFNDGFRRVTFFELLQEHTGVDFQGLAREEVASHAKQLGVEVEDSMGLAKLLDEIFSEKVEPTLIQPTFVCDHPKELSPLAKQHRSHPHLVERFEPFIAGFEVGNAFSELNDPRDQRARFEDQVRLAEAGDDEAQLMDVDYLRALEYGMPPTGGLGVGIDRVAMLFTNSHSIRDVLFFPQMRAEG